MLITKYYFLPEDNFEHQMSENGRNFWMALDDIRDHLRSKVKYDDSLSEEQYVAYEKMYETFFEILEANNVNLDVE